MINELLESKNLIINYFVHHCYANNGTLVDNDNSKAESFNNYFSSVFSKEDDSCLPELPEGYPSIDAVDVYLLKE